jgi:hypothetical protein
MKAAIAIFLTIKTPCFPFSRGDSQEMAHPHRPFRSHSGERRHSGRAVRKARNGTFEQRVPLAMVQPEARGIEFNSVESTVRYLAFRSTTLSP